MTTPFSDLRDTYLSDPMSRRLVKIYKRQMERAITLSELRKSLGLSQRAVAVRLNRTQANVSRLEHEEDPHLSSLEEYVESLGGRLSLHVTFDDQEIPLIIKR